VYWVSVDIVAGVSAALLSLARGAAPGASTSPLHAVTARDAESAITAGAAIHLRRFRNMIPER
jgi:hypothetical protein